VHVVHVLEAVALDLRIDVVRDCEFEQVMHILAGAEERADHPQLRLADLSGCDRERAPKPAANTILPCLAIPGTRRPTESSMSTILSITER